MTPTIRIVGLGGSLAARSTSLAALRLALEGARAAGAEIELFDVRALDLPMYDPDRPDVPAAAAALAEACYAAHGLIWSSPLYHGSVSGAFKNAIDWLHPLGERTPAYLSGKVIGMIGVAGGVQGLQAVNTMEFVVRALRGYAVPLVIPVPNAARVFDARGDARDPAVERQLLALGAEVHRAARQLARDGVCDYAAAGTPHDPRGAAAAIQTLTP